MTFQKGGIQPFVYFPLTASCVIDYREERLSVWTQHTYHHPPPSSISALRCEEAALYDISSRRHYRDTYHQLPIQVMLQSMLQIILRGRGVQEGLQQGVSGNSDSGLWKVL